MISKYFARKRAVIAALAGCMIALCLVGFSAIESAWNSAVPITQASRQIPYNQNRVGPDINSLSLKPYPVSEKDLDGALWLGILESDWNGGITLETPQDKITIVATNASYSRLNLILKVFYNYSEVTFRVLGTEIMDTELLFSLDSAQKVNIPLQLPEHLIAEEAISKLTVGIFEDPQHYVASSDTVSEDLRFSSGIALNFEINYGFDTNLSLSTDSLNDFNESAFFGFVVHPDPVVPDDGSLRLLPDTLSVRRGEEIGLSFFANGDSNGEELGSYLIMSMLDWQQIYMDGSPYLWLNLPEGRVEVGQYADFSIVAPDALGFYEFLALKILQPTHQNSVKNFFPLEMIRFTIEVVQ